METIENTITSADLERYARVATLCKAYEGEKKELREKIVAYVSAGKTLPEQTSELSVTAVLKKVQVHGPVEKLEAVINLLPEEWQLKVEALLDRMENERKTAYELQVKANPAAAKIAEQVTKEVA
jgi:hypothetical protein